MACPPGHPLSKKKNLKLNDLKNEPFIYRESGSGTRMVMEEELKNAGVYPEKTMELATNEAVKQAIMAGIGVSLISQLSMKTELKAGTISTINIENYPIQTNWHVLYRRNKAISRVFLNFIEFLMDKKITSYLP
jgi:DNA-binding transcriptional LysR family regulator